ncbi:hypothetical protein T07_838 [Trichinella nelsoni]|uniref:Uncharacterized protein n=1 Tax=Trichinella nelsoni TaxID=6336 RepID=A0A0V0RE70_9BILA|nr:hypothetical protein T07_838 [Trichinella nelsoni]
MYPLSSITTALIDFICDRQHFIAISTKCPKTISFSELAMALLNVPVVTFTLEVQILMLLIAFAAMIAFLVLCGWCNKGEGDGNKQAAPPRSPQPLYPCYPPGQVYPQQMGAPGFMPMTVPNYIVRPSPPILTPFPAAAPAPPPASVEPEGGVDPELEDMAKGQSARDTMADVPSIKDHLPPKRKQIFCSVYRTSSKNSVHDGINHFIGKKCGKIFVKKSSFFISYS